jgi:hypothetical protein
MPKRQRSKLHARVTVKLDTVMGIAREMGRLIRLSYNGHITISELTGHMYALDKLRGCLESAIAIETAAKAAAPPPAPGNVAISILSVPSGYFLSEAQRREDYKWDIDAIKNEQKQLTQAEPPRPAPELPIETGGLETPSVFAAQSPSEPEPVAPEPPPEPELSPVMRRAMAMGYRPLPRRICPAD